MKKIFYLLPIIFVVYACKNDCSNIISAPCPSPLFNYAIIKFDTTQGNFKQNDLDTFFLYEDTLHIINFTPSDTILLKGQNQIQQSKTKRYHYLSDKLKKNVFKIYSPKTEFKKDVGGCGSCDDIEFISIQINDSTYIPSQLPVLIKKK